MALGALTSKGQIAIPKQIRQELKLSAGHRVEFLVDPAGYVVMKPRNKDIRSLKGIVRSRRRRPVSIAEMNEAIARGYSGE